jgi:hypothetical protein
MVALPVTAVDYAKFLPMLRNQQFFLAGEYSVHFTQMHIDFTDPIKRA